MNSQRHRKPLSAQPTIDKYVNNDEEKKNTNKATQRLEIQLCGFLAEHNISFTVLDHLTTVIKNGVTDSEIVKSMQLKSTKGTAIVKNVLAECEKDDLQRKLKNNLFSILIDESTDIGGIQTMCIIVR